MAAVQQDGGHVEVHLALGGVPAQGRVDVLDAGALWQVHHGAFLHGKGRLDPLGRVRDHGAHKVPNGGLEDVDEVLPILCGQIQQTEAPAIPNPDQGPHKVDLLIAGLQVKATDLPVIAVFQEVESAILGILQVAAAVHREDKGDEAHLPAERVQVCPHDLVKAAFLTGGLVAGVREAATQGLEVVVVHRAQQLAGAVEGHCLQV
mmetsp:Transcript_110207/g.307079  ORF Transcript_110207/g.307079 Transcript_110207/m.307079 type:complete len:205 (+) Transcript_110207:608-1222(+)